MDTTVELIQDERVMESKESERKALSRVIDEAGMTDPEVVVILKDIMLNAYTANPKTGDYYPDFSTRLQAIRAWHKFKSGNPDVQVQIANIFP